TPCCSDGVAACGPLLSFPTRRSSDLVSVVSRGCFRGSRGRHRPPSTRRLADAPDRDRSTSERRRDRRHPPGGGVGGRGRHLPVRSEEHTSELQSREKLVCRLLLEKKR